MKAFLLRNRRFLFILFMMIVDVGLLILSFLSAYGLRYVFDQNGAPVASYINLLIVFIPCWIIVFAVFGLYRIRRGWRFSELLFNTTFAVTIGMVVFLFFSYLFKQFFYSRLLLLYFWFINILLISVSRVYLKRLVILFREMGIGVKKVLVVGNSTSTELLTKTLKIHPELGYKIVATMLPVGTVEMGQGEPNSKNNCNSVIGETSNIIDEIINLKIDEIIFTISPGRSSDLWAIVNACQRHGIGVRMVPEIYEIFSCQIAMDDIGGIPIIQFEPVRLQIWEKIMKLAFDYVGAIVFSIITLPLTLFIYLKLRFTYKGNVITKEERIGQHGKRFFMYRFSVPIAYNGSGSGIQVDTPVFIKFIEKYYLTELPQFLNVIKGEMSLIGPRPERIDRVERYNERQRRRLLVKPGIVGSAQINMLRGFVALDERLFFDLEYIECQSFSNDVKIMLQGIWFFLRLVIKKESPAEKAVQNLENRR